MELGGCGGSGLAPESQTEVNLSTSHPGLLFLKNNNSKQNTLPQQGLNVTLEWSVCLTRISV